MEHHKSAVGWEGNLNWTEHSSNTQLLSHLVDDTDIRRQLWKCFRLWITRPNAYDRSVGATRLFYYTDRKSTTDSIHKVLSEVAEEQIDVEHLLAKLMAISGQLGDEDEAFEMSSLRKADCHDTFVVRVNFPKRVKSNGISVCVFHVGATNDTTSCYTPGSLEKSYRISFDDGQKRIIAQIPAGFPPNAHTERLLSTFFTKAIVWSRTVVSNPTIIRSVALVGEDAYLLMYRRLKTKYGDSLRQMWTECTNPEKFIHEDIAIASYLNLLWGPSRTFVDLGCGNGLLVYILTAEGHRGVGLDVRARKIWTKYPTTTQLRADAINPSDCVFPDVDWIVGNHSDELTPWIPVIAAKSSYHAHFFLLPCCPYDFSGEKYKRINSSKSQYSDYMDYVERISVQCGFSVARDRLKIPSTKRLCFVSRGRVYARSEFTTYCHKISELVKNGVETVRIRESVEPVRNCTKLDRNLVSDIVNQVSRLILGSTSSSSHNDWNEGDFIDLPLVAQALGSDQLVRLKNECGGLQTLLRNHRYIFRVERGRVKFRRPQKLDTRPSKWKVAPCWFYDNHPQSCPLGDEECSFVHERSVKC